MEAVAERLAKIKAGHPRLHFNLQGRELLRQRAAGTHRRYAELLFDWVKRNRGWSPPSELPDHALNEVVLEQSGAFVTNAALAWVLSGRDDHLQLAQRWTLAMCEVPRGEVRNYGLGIYAAGLARAYDWLFDQWSPSERQRIREHVARLVEQVYFGSLPGHEKRQWWADAHLHHDHWIPVGGFGEAALALLAEVDDAPRWAAQAKVDFDVCLSWLGDDGAWHEGPADWCYTLAPLLWFYGAWQTAVGEDLHDARWLRNTAAYRLYHWLPDDSYVYLNDSFRSGRYNTSGSASCHLLRRLASLFGDGYAQWLADRDEAFDLKPGPKGVYQAPYEGSSFKAQRTEYPHPDSQCVAWNVLWYDADVKPNTPTELPRARRFANADVAILRTGWDQDAAVASLSCGPLAGHRCAERMRAGEPRLTGNYSHAHSDYNAFTLFAGGQYFIIPPGYARRSSHFQNTVSVNGADFRTDASLDVRMVAFRIEDGFSYAVGDATAAFPPHLGVKRYRRHLLLLQGGGCVLFDEVALESRAGRPWNRFQWTVHSDPRVHRVGSEGPRLVWKPLRREGPQLRLVILEPQEFAWQHERLDSLDGNPMLQAHRLLRPEWYSERMSVLAVFFWDARRHPAVVVRHPRLLVVEIDPRPSSALVGFALSPLNHGQVDTLVDSVPRGRKLLLFGHDPTRPGAYILARNGKIQEFPD